MRKVPAGEIAFTHQAPPGLLSAWAASGRAVKLGPRLYSTNVKEAPDVIIRRNLWAIIAGYYPDALLADRTALDLAPAEDGSVFLISAKPRSIDLPGVLLRPRYGHGPLPGDYTFREGLQCSSTARAYLENMRPSRRRLTVARTLPRPELEHRLDRFLRNSGPDVFNRMRDAILALAPPLGLVAEARELDAIMGTLLGTRDTPLSDAAAIARASGRPVDPRRIDLFDALHDALRTVPPLSAADQLESKAFSLRAFYEAYFSNFIEGTEFSVDEARRIVDSGTVPRERPEDGHDILGTFLLVSNRAEQMRPLSGVDDFISTLKTRHSLIMGKRLAAGPGTFKTMVNRAGGTTFVHPEAVEGTLRAGYQIVDRLSDPFHRAAAMMFVVSEIHPFTDGNGRLSRAMMNAELLRQHQSPIIIPTVYRDNYLAALQRLSHHGDPDAYIRMLLYAHRYVRAIPWANPSLAAHVLSVTHAFEKPAEAEQRGHRLRLPEPNDVLVVPE